MYTKQGPKFGDTGEEMSHIVKGELDFPLHLNYICSNTLISGVISRVKKS